MKRIILIAVCSSLLLANTTNHNSSYNNQQGNVVIGRDIPESTPRDKYRLRARDRVELNTNNNAIAYKITQQKITQRQRVLSNFYDTQVSMKPAFRLFKSVDNLKITPLLVTTIILPKDIVITDAVASFDTRYFTFKENNLRIQPKDSTFFSGNIVLALTDGNRNFAMTIFVEKYYQLNQGTIRPTLAIDDNNKTTAQDEDSYLYGVNKKVDLNQGSSDYQNSLEAVSMIYQYVLPRVLTPEDAIIIYERMTKTRVMNLDIMDGDYVSFIYDGITYRIVRNDKQGTLIYGDKAYIVENSTQDGLSW